MSPARPTDQPLVWAIARQLTRMLGGRPRDQLTAARQLLTSVLQSEEQRPAAAPRRDALVRA